MDSYKFLGFVEILKESIKVLAKNGKVMALIVTLSCLLHSVFYFFNILYIQPLFINDIIVNQTNPPTPNLDGSYVANPMFGMIKVMRIFLGVELVFLLINFIISFFSSIAIIFTSATSYCNKDLSFYDLLLWVQKSWIWPLATMFYIQLLTMGCIGIFFVAIMIPSCMILDHPVVATTIIILLGIFATAVHLYLSVVWVLALVVSVIEKSCYGIEALGKAGQIVKGKKLDGFMLNMLQILVWGVIFYVYWMGKDSRRSAIQMLLMLFASILLAMIQQISYTVLYFQCKKYHGEETELQGGIQYGKIPTAPLVHEDIP